MALPNTHEPVMVAEVLDLLQPSRGGLFVDCTAGLGGHYYPFYSAFSTQPQYYFGNAFGNYNYPYQDFQFVFGWGVSYTNKIHVDPCCPSVRTVTAKGDPPLYSSVCTSGAQTARADRTRAPRARAP